MDITRQPRDLHVTLDLSEYKRAFVVGDIHGEFLMLGEALEVLNFNWEFDALICVGDLADRGPQSDDALEWIDRPNIFRVLGNHDIMPRLYLDGQASRSQIESWGGEWFVTKPRHEIEKIATAFDNAPIALTVLSPGGKRIGVAHADCLRDWNAYTDALKLGSKDRIWATDMSLWSRETIKALMKLQTERLPLDPSIAQVKDIDHVFHGHTMLGEMFTCANRSWIDTGACMGGHLTLVNIDTMEKYHAV